MEFKKIEKENKPGAINLHALIAKDLTCECYACAENERRADGWLRMIEAGKIDSIIAGDKAFKLTPIVKGAQQNERPKNAGPTRKAYR